MRWPLVPAPTRSFGPPMRYGRLPGTIIMLATLAVAACSGLFDSDEPTFSVGFELEHALPVPTVLHADVGRYNIRITAPEPGLGRARSTLVPRARAGTVPVRLTVLTTSGDTLATMQFTQELERDHDHWVTAQIGRQRPFGFCFGTPSATPLRSDNTDTLFVIAGGLQRGAIC